MKINRFLAFVVLTVLLAFSFALAFTQPAAAASFQDQPPAVHPFWSALAQNLLMAFAPVLASFLTGLLYVQIRKAWAQFKSYQPDIADTIEWAAKLAVKAAEQAGAAQLIDDKKDYALEIAERYLHAKGLKSVDLHLVSAAIEAEVLEQFNKYRDEYEDWPEPDGNLPDEEFPDDDPGNGNGKDKPDKPKKE